MQTRCIEGNRLEVELFTMVWECARLPHARSLNEKVDGMAGDWEAAGEGGGGGGEERDGE